MKPRAGINTNRRQFEYVFSKEVQNGLTALFELDLDSIPEVATEESVAESVEGAEVVISTWGALPYTKPILESCPGLKLILYGAGSFKGYVTTELLAVDPIVCTAVHLNAVPTAEYTLALILISLKNSFAYHDQITRTGREGWMRDRLTFSGGYYKSTIGILGYGLISRHLMRLLSNFDFEVLIADDHVTADQARELGARKTDVDSIMQTSDVVTIHHADVERNWNIVDRRSLSLMKMGARLINTSRGRMIDEEALGEKLREGSIWAYLDVTHPEPPAPGHPFYTLPNCVITPHVAGAIGREVERLGEYCLREAEAWLAGRPLENPIDITALEGRA